MGLLMTKQQNTQLQITDLGAIAYDDAMQLMSAAHERVVNNKGPEEIFILEHVPAVITKGRRLHGVNIPLHPELTKMGVQLRDADRGGQLTFHGPGQIVVYFVIRVNDHFAGVSQMVHALEDALLAFLKQQGITAHTDPDHPGVWVGDQKIASIGLRVSQGVTRHGISLNISNNLAVFKYFSPCGLSGESMTNLEKLLGKAIPFLDESKKELLECFEQFFN